MQNKEQGNHAVDLEFLDSIKIKDEHHVYHEWYLNERTGGPPGYLANLLLGFNQITDHFAKPLIVFDNLRGKAPAKTKQTLAWHKKLSKSIFRFLTGSDQFYKRYLSGYNRRFYRDQKLFLSNLNTILPNPSITDKMDWSKVRSVHAHTVAELLKMRNFLSQNFYDNVKLILTCHTPESVAKEQYGVYIEGGLDDKRAAELAERWGEIEKLAFQSADIIIFPSEEAMEPMLHDIPNFRELISGKDIRFMATGAKQLHSNLTQDEAKEKFGVSGKKVVGFIGRHNYIKGYDLLKDAAQEVLRQRDDVAFLIGGTQGKEFSPLKHPSWVEAGWVQPADLFQALDVFVLPNRQTYYDLVLLEVLSTGTPVIATATGGNKSVKKIAEDMILCDVAAASMADAIIKFLDQEEAQRNAIGKNLRAVYENHFTEKHMAQRYVDTVIQIYNDYDLWAEDAADTEGGNA